VVRRPGSHLAATEILDFMAERAAKIKRLSGGIIFCDTIPKNPVRSLAARKQIHDYPFRDTDAPRPLIDHSLTSLYRVGRYSGDSSGIGLCLT
jgi:hypothetical protein